MTVSTPPESLMDVMFTSDSSRPLSKRSGATGRWAMTGEADAAWRRRLVVGLLDVGTAVVAEQSKNSVEKSIHRARFSLRSNGPGDGLILKRHPARDTSVCFHDVVGLVEHAHLNLAVFAEFHFRSLPREFGHRTGKSHLRVVLSIASSSGALVDQTPFSSAS